MSDYIVSVVRRVATFWGAPVIIHLKFEPTGRGDMKSTVLILVAASTLAGCGSPFGSAETRACEEFVKGTRSSPATYKRAEVTTFDSPTTRTALQSEYGAERFAYLPDQGLETREVIIKFDMQNAYGTPIRGITSCKFLLVNKKPLHTGKSLNSAVASAISRAALLDAIEAGALPGVRPALGAEASCCLR